MYNNHYLPFCERCQSENIDGLPMTSSSFFAARKEHRPYYKKHRKVFSKLYVQIFLLLTLFLLNIQVKNTKWRHIECSECVLFDEQISRAKNKVEKLRLEGERQDHWDYQQRERDSYDYQVVKVFCVNNLYSI